MTKLVIGLGVVLVAIVIAYGTLQAQEEFDNSPPVFATSTPTATATPAPAPVLKGSRIVFQVRGGNDHCRYMYTGNRVGTFAGGEIVLEFVAGTHDATGLAATGEMHLYGDTGPHDFKVLDSAGRQVAAVHVGRGETTMATVVFEQVGLYRLFESTMRIHVSEIFARPISQPGHVPATGWCES